MPTTRVVPVVPVAASALSLQVLAGRRRDARVLAAFPSALYLALGPHHEVLPVLTRDALALPAALRLPHVAHTLPWSVEQGDLVEVGGGCVLLPGMRLTVGRVWHPVPVRSVAPGDRARSGVPPHLVRERVSGHLRDLAADLTVAVLSDVDPHALLRRLVGAGQGLTPSGDDAVCGVLLTLRAFGVLDDRFDRLAGALEKALPTTTSISASLLGAAVDGYALHAAVRLIEAVVSGRPRETAVALPTVLAVGHSSGADLVAGLLGALDALRSYEPVRPPTLPPEGACRD